MYTAHRHTTLPCTPPAVMPMFYTACSPAISLYAPPTGMSLCHLHTVAVYRAVQLGHVGVCEVLVNSLVDIHAKTANGFTALHYAVGYRR